MTPTDVVVVFCVWAFTGSVVGIVIALGIIRLIEWQENQRQRAALRTFVDPIKAMAETVICPRCGAGVGVPCVVPNGRAHVVRWGTAMQATEVPTEPRA